MKTKLILLVALVATIPAVARPQSNPPSVQIVIIDYAPTFYKYWAWLGYAILP